jgi:hypothetical protein
MMPTPVEETVAPAAIERALMIYEWLKERDHATVVQARKALTERIYAMIAAGEIDNVRLVVGGLTYLKDRDRSRNRGPYEREARKRAVVG